MEKIKAKETEEETWRRLLGTPIMEGDVVRFRHGKVEWFVYRVWAAPSGNRYLYLKSLHADILLGPDKHTRLRLIRHAK